MTDLQYIGESLAQIKPSEHPFVVFKLTQGPIHGFFIPQLDFMNL